MVNYHMEATNNTEVKSPFETIDEVLADGVLVESVRRQIKDIEAKRWARPEPKPGYLYKRDWYDRHHADFNTQFFLDNIVPIWVKRSPLSSEWRGVILFICDRALKEAILTKLK